MALTRSAQAPQASATQTAGAGDTVSSALAIGYGVSGLAKVTNGATGPTIACDFYIEASNDGGTTWFEVFRATAGVANNGVYRFPFSFGVAGIGGDWTHYRTGFGSNTAQNVTIQADATTTTAL